MKTVNFNQHDYYGEFLKYLENIRKDHELTDEVMNDAVSDFKKLYKERLKNKTIKEYEEEQIQLKEAERKQDIVDEATEMELPMDWENVFDSDDRTNGVTASTPADALILSQSNLGYVDIEYMASVTGLSYKDIIVGLKGSIYQNPEKWEECFYKGWETADEYLSGNLREKLKIAEDYNKMYKGYFNDNVLAITKLLPKGVTSGDIYVTLGSPWLPVDIVEDFIDYMFSINNKFTLYRKRIKRVKHDELTGTWELSDKSMTINFTESYSKYGTRRMSALQILEKSLNSQTAVVYDYVPSASGKAKMKRFINRKETALAIEKQNYQKDVFNSWVWENKTRKKNLETIFDNKFCSFRIRRYDGSFLTFPGMNKNITLYPYQKDAVARILFSKNTLLAHDVGSGKTYVMATAGMELKRIGLSTKNLYVVPNNIVGQWYEIFKDLYPDAKLLTVDPKSFVPAKRLKVLNDIKNNDYDGIIMAYSCFNMIPLSTEYKISELEDQLKVVEEAIKNEKVSSRGLKQREKKLKDEIKRLSDDIIAGTVLPTFDKLGITEMFIDEAHNYKNVPLESSITNTYGVSDTGSKKCKEMLDKVRYIQSKRNGGGIVMATGTPITNSLTDLFVMQKYLQNSTLSTLDIGNFDSWVGMFAERESNFEIDVDTSNYRLVSRFSKFHNLPELTSLIAMIADFHQMCYDADLPDFKGYDDIIVRKSKNLQRYLEKISRRADEVRSGKINRHDDNMLKITTDGRKAALDIRLVENVLFFNDECKVKSCADKVKQIYFDTMDKKCTQLVFSDIAIPGSKFSVYTELKRLLIKMGVNGDEIAFVHDADTEKKREKLFADVRNGDIRVLIGSTFKLGMGVNVQDRLIAVHHLDVPWRPADMRQREGRIIRQGNLNPEVKIYRYITEGSFDAYSWQLLETKQNFITALLSGSMVKRTGDDVDDTVLSYGEIKALAIGNPLIKERVETQNELNRNVLLKRKTAELKEFMRKRLADIPNLVAGYKTDYDNALSDQQLLDHNKSDYTNDERRYKRSLIHNFILNNVMKDNEENITDYNGFTIVAPKFMLAEKPFIVIRGAGDYVLKLGDGERGILTRLDNFFDGFNAVAQNIDNKIKELNSEMDSLIVSIKEKEDYTPKIEELRKKLIDIDKRLGVTKR